MLGVLLRLLLALVNEEGNDPHLPVISTIAFEHRFPAKDEAWEAFQPKLYHLTVAAVWQLVPTRVTPVLTRVAQLVSCVAGVLTLLVVLRFQRERRTPQPARAIAFSLVALSPALIGTSGQATNDAFVVLFGTLTLYYGARFFTRWRTRDFAALVAAAVLCGISKGNGLVAIVAVLATFGVATLFPSLLGEPGVGRRDVALFGAIFLLLVGPAVALIGPYASYARRYGTPFVTNWTPSPRPHLRQETFVERPGLTSLVHGLATFRFGDLLRNPDSNWDPRTYHRHRTSLWTRVYAQAHSAHFEHWPPTWIDPSPWLRQLTRLLFVLGLLPTALLLLGLPLLAARAARRPRHSAPNATEAGEAAGDRARATADGQVGGESPAATLLLLLGALGYLAFVALYSIRLRDYSSMKTIFLLPGLLAFVAMLELGTARADAWSRTGLARALRPIAASILGLLLLGYAVDVGALIAHLARS